MPVEVWLTEFRDACRLWMTISEKLNGHYETALLASADQFGTGFSEDPHWPHIEVIQVAYRKEEDPFDETVFLKLSNSLRWLFGDADFRQLAQSRQSAIDKKSKLKAEREERERQLREKERKETRRREAVEKANRLAELAQQLVDAVANEQTLIQSAEASFATAKAQMTKAREAKTQAQEAVHNWMVSPGALRLEGQESITSVVKPALQQVTKIKAAIEAMLRQVKECQRKMLAAERRATKISCRLTELSHGGPADAPKKEALGARMEAIIAAMENYHKEVSQIVDDVQQLQKVGQSPAFLFGGGGAGAAAPAFFSQHSDAAAGGDGLEDPELETIISNAIQYMPGVTAGINHHAGQGDRLWRWVARFFGSAHFYSVAPQIKQFMMRHKDDHNSWFHSAFSHRNLPSALGEPWVSFAVYMILFSSFPVFMTYQAGKTVRVSSLELYQAAQVMVKDHNKLTGDFPNIYAFLFCCYCQFVRDTAMEPDQTPIIEKELEKITGVISPNCFNVLGLVESRCPETSFQSHPWVKPVGCPENQSVLEYARKLLDEARTHLQDQAGEGTAGAAFTAQ